MIIIGNYNEESPACNSKGNTIIVSTNEPCGESLRKAGAGKSIRDEIGQAVSLPNYLIIINICW